MYQKAYLHCKRNQSSPRNPSERASSNVLDLPRSAARRRASELLQGLRCGCTRLVFQVYSLKKAITLPQKEGFRVLLANDCLRSLPEPREQRYCWRRGHGPFGIEDKKNACANLTQAFCTAIRSFSGGCTRLSVKEQPDVPQTREVRHSSVIWA
jgi:hypothetical protein